MNPSRLASRDFLSAQRFSNFAPLPGRTVNRFVATYRSRARGRFPEVSSSSSAAAMIAAAGDAVVAVCWSAVEDRSRVEAEQRDDEGSDLATEGTTTTEARKDCTTPQQILTRSSKRMRRAAGVEVEDGLMVDKDEKCYSNT